MHVKEQTHIRQFAGVIAVDVIQKDAPGRCEPLLLIFPFLGGDVDLGPSGLGAVRHSLLACAPFGLEGETNGGAGILAPSAETG